MGEVSYSGLGLGFSVEETLDRRGFKQLWGRFSKIWISQEDTHAASHPKGSSVNMSISFI